MCHWLLADSLRYFALALAILVPIATSLFIATRLRGAQGLLVAALVGTAAFATPVVSSVLSINHCAAIAWESYDMNQDGVFDSSEHTFGYSQVEALAVGDGGRNVFALLSPALGLVYSLLLYLLISLAKVKVRVRWQAKSDA